MVSVRSALGRTSRPNRPLVPGLSLDINQPADQPGNTGPSRPNTFIAQRKSASLRTKRPQVRLLLGVLGRLRVRIPPTCTGLIGPPICRVMVHRRLQWSTR